MKFEGEKLPRREKGTGSSLPRLRNSAYHRGAVTEAAETCHACFNSPRFSRWFCPESPVVCDAAVVPRTSCSKSSWPRTSFVAVENILLVTRRIARASARLRCRIPRSSGAILAVIPDPKTPLIACSCAFWRPWSVAPLRPWRRARGLVRNAPGNRRGVAARRPLPSLPPPSVRRLIRRLSFF